VRAISVSLLVLLTACPKSTDDSGDSGDAAFPTTSCADYAAPCVEIEAGDSDTLLETVNLLEDDQTIILAAGEWSLDNQVTLRNGDGVSLLGQGMDLTLLDFSAQAVQTNGVDVIGDNFTLQDLTVLDAKKDGVRVEDSTGVTLRRVRVTWTEEESSENGAYGLYPVRSSHVLVEECESFNSADAGIYVGQVSHTIVRNNLASGNVAGIEIENTQYADVYENIAENNTGGLLIFDMPGNPIVTRDVWIHDNIVRDNNTANFAPSGTVAAIPAGTGTVILAARRVVLTGNTYENNNTTDIAVINGLAIEGNTDSWAIAAEDILGDWDDLNLTTDGTSYYNFRPNEILIANNTHSGSGSDPDINDYKDRAIGFVVGVAYGDEKVDDVLYDGIGESSFSATDPDENSNDNHICVGKNTNGTYATLDLETLAARMETFDFPDISDLFRPEVPFAPFDCTELTGGDIAEVTIEAP